MTLSELKSALSKIDSVLFEMPEGTFVPAHAHLTEVGWVTKHFIDCGGTFRKENRVSLQLWTAEDVDHRLGADKMLKIIELSERTLPMEDSPVEVEVQGQTVENYGIDFNGKHFTLIPRHTDCLAKENCGIPELELNTVSNSCGSGNCC